MLLCSKKDNKTADNYVFQFYHAPLYLDRFEALNKTGSDYEANTPSGRMMADGLRDKYWNIRVQALKNIGVQLKANKETLKPVIVRLAEADSSAAVRTQAIKTLGKYFKEDEEARAAIGNAIHDISYNVQAAAFKFIAENDKENAASVAKQLEKSHGSDVLNAVANFYADEAKEENNDFFLGALSVLRGYSRGSFAGNYAKYLKKVSEKTRDKGIEKLVEVAGYSSGSGKNMIISALQELSKNLSDKVEEAKARADELKKNNGGKNEIDLALREADELNASREALQKKISSLIGTADSGAE
jgi:aminopeptidase N